MDYFVGLVTLPLVILIILQIVVINKLSELIEAVKNEEKPPRNRLR